MPTKGSHHRFCRALAEETGNDVLRWATIDAVAKRLDIEPREAILLAAECAAAHQAAGLQLVDAVRDGARADQRLLAELPGGQLVRRSGPPQRGQDVELGRVQAMRGERLPPGPVQVPGQPGDPGQHGQRLDVQLGALPPPRLDQKVHLVPHAPRLAEPLDIEI